MAGGTHPPAPGQATGGTHLGRSASTGALLRLKGRADETMGGTPEKSFLTSKFQVGSCRSDKINYSLAQKVFHSGDIPEKVVLSKKAVNKSKHPNILGVEQQHWNQTTISDPKIQKDVVTDLKRTLLKVRAGLVDQPVIDAKGRSEEELADLCRYIVSVTGKGPIGKLTGKWFNPVDERGLSAHIDPKWQDWAQSTSTKTPEDIKQAETVFGEREERRFTMNVPSEQVNMEAYVDPTTGIANLNMKLQEKKVEYQDLKEQFKRELKVEFPNASEERLQAMGQRLLNEKLLADEKLKRFPVQHESFRPNLSLTSQDRRFKTFYHPGTWAWNEIETRFCWSCCLNFDQGSKGCEHKVVNPDAWCTLGFGS